MSGNLNSVFERARGDYLWIWGDDDLPIEGSVATVADLLIEFSPMVALVNTDNIESLDDANVKYVVKARNRLGAQGEQPVFAEAPADIEPTFQHLREWAYLTNLLSAVIVKREPFLRQLTESRILLGDENVYQFQHPVLALAASKGRVLIVTRSVCLHRKNTTSWSASIDASMPCFIDSAAVIRGLEGAYSSTLLEAYSRRMARQCLDLMVEAKARGVTWSAENEGAFIAAYGELGFGGLSLRKWISLLRILPLQLWKVFFRMATRLQRRFGRLR
jgi:hypothetical protein